MVLAELLNEWLDKREARRQEKQKCKELEELQKPKPPRPANQDRPPSRTYTDKPIVPEEDN